MGRSEVLVLLRQVEFARRRLLRPYFSGLGLATAGQGKPRILACLLAGEGLTQRELAEACCLDATTLSRSLDRLEEAGLIARACHPDSRRAYLVRLTEAGREKARAVEAGYAAVDALLQTGFAPAELAALTAGLRRIRGNLEARGRLDL